MGSINNNYYWSVFLLYFHFPILFVLVVLYFMIFGFSAIGSSFDGVIAGLVNKHSNQRSQLLEFGHQDYLQQSHCAENTLVKICNMAAILFLWFLVLVSVVLGDEIGNWKKYGKSKFLVQFSKGERVSVTSLFLKERVSNFCFLASGSSSLSFLSCPRSSTGDRVSVTVLFLALNSQISFLDVLWF